MARAASEITHVRVLSPNADWRPAVNLLLPPRRYVVLTAQGFSISAEMRYTITSPKMTVCSDHENNEDLRRHRFQEPCGLKLLRRDLEDENQNGECENIKQGR